MNKHLCNKMLSPLVVFLIMVMLELPYLFPQWLYKFAPPLAINKCCLSPQPHLNELQLILIGLGHSDWYKQRPQRSFDLHIFYYSFKCFSVTGVSFFGNPLFISVPHCLLARWFYWCLGFLFVFYILTLYLMYNW